MATLPRTAFGIKIDAWLIILAIGLGLIALPTLASLAEQSWSREEGVHGPIVIATGGWLIWRQRAQIAPLATPGSPIATWLMIVPLLLIYMFGRAFDFLSLEAIGLLGTGFATAYALIGGRALRRLWFPLIYFLFLVPMPGWFVDQLTAPLKQFVSFASEAILAAMGIPIVRQGVVLFVDQYQLLVEDACAGLNSLFSLASISLFYIYLRHNASWGYALFLLLWIVPIAIFANIVRVMLLVLITHFWGEAAAQGFLHNSAGMVMFVAALLGIFALDLLFMALGAGRRGR